MKKLVLVLALVVALAPATLMVLPRSADAAAVPVCVNGARKGITWRDGEWHHYVEFDVPTSGYTKVSGPLWPSFWGYADGRHARAGYRMFGKFPDPVPASWWKICR